MCPNEDCRFVYSLENCMFRDPRNNERFVTKVCKNVLFPSSKARKECLTPLLQSVRASDGTYYLRVIPSQILILPGMGFF